MSDTKELKKETRLDRWLSLPCRALYDSHLSPRRWPAVPVKDRIAWTTRARLAQFGIYRSTMDARLAEFADLHRGETCFILGNGPSLNKVDLTPLAGEFTFGVNSIFLNRGRMNFDPTYYVVEDPLVLEDRHEQINNYVGPQMKFFGNYARRFIHESPDVCFTNVRLRYDEYRGFPYFAKDARRGMWAGGSVSYLCLQLAYFMGFSEVVLLGFDHNYVVPADAKVEGNRIESMSADPNHFHPDYFGKGYRWHTPRTDRMELAFERAKKVFEASGRRIVNATVGGQLEVFDRVDYGQLFPRRLAA